MISLKDTLKATEARIVALKRELAEQEALLPGLRFAVKELNGHAHEAVAVVPAADEPTVTGRLRLGDDTKVVLELLEQRGTLSLNFLGNKLGDKRKMREAVRNLSNRELITKDDDNATITNLGRVFMRQYAEKH